MHQPQILSENASRGAFQLNPRLTGFSCIRCSADWPIADYPEGCPSCARDGEPATVRPRFLEPAQRMQPGPEHDMRRYAAWMPYTDWITLGEGGTPCLPARRIADELGIADVFIKNEGQNPTGSHKDRVSCLAVTRALDIGAKGIVAASSGNGGASVALYAASAGLPCRIVVTPSLSPVFRRAITMTGAELVEVPESLERWSHTAELVRQGWFSATNYRDPPVGSNAFGLPGLMTVAFELAEDFGRELPGIVLVPTSRGDLIWGLFEGFAALKRASQIATMPKLYAIEPFGRIARVLDGEPVTSSFPGATRLTSIGGSTVTYQAMLAIRGSGGGAIPVDDAAVVSDQRKLAEAGYYTELSSAATLTGLKRLQREGHVSPADRVVLVATSNGYKDWANEGARP